MTQLCITPYCRVQQFVADFVRQWIWNACQMPGLLRLLNNKRNGFGRLQWSMPSWLDLLIGAGVGSVGTYALLRKPARLQRRHQYFLNKTGGTTAGISHDLLWTAHVLLRQALEERRTPVWRSADNHAARFAPIIVITITTAFDAWMNELVAFGRTWIGLPQDEIAKLIDIGTVPEK